LVQIRNVGRASIVPERARISSGEVIIKRAGYPRPPRWGRRLSVASARSVRWRVHTFQRPVARPVVPGFRTSGLIYGKFSGRSGFHGLQPGTSLLLAEEGASAKHQRR